MGRKISNIMKSALEAIDEIPLVAPEVPEDGQIDLTNSDVSIYEQNAMMAEISRTYDIHDGLSDLVRVTESLETLTPHHMAYLQIATNMALAGTPYDATALIPSLESSTDKPSMEDMRSALKSLIDNILAMLKGLMNKFFEFWGEMKTDVGRTRAANGRLAIRAKASSGRSIKDNEVELKNERPKLEILGRPITNASALLRGLKDAQRQAIAVLHGHTASVIHSGEAIASALASPFTTAEDLNTAANTAAETLDLNALISNLQAKPYKDVRFSANEVVSGTPLLGNRSIFINADGNGDVRKRYTTISTSTNDSPRPLSETSIATTFSADEVTQISGIVGEILDLVDEYTKTVLPKLDSTVKKLNDDVVKLRGATADLNLPAADESLIGQVARYPIIYTSWSHRLQDALCNHLVTVCKASMIVCNNSLALHE